jgi:hypothetical protein
MNDALASHEPRALIAELARSLRAWLNKYAPLRALDECGEDEVGRIARDLGLKASELRTLAIAPASSSELLYRRLAALRLQREEIGRLMPAVLRDLQNLCSRCASKKRCTGDLAQGTLDSTWQDYCANAYTLRALVAATPEPDAIEDLLVYLNTIGNGPSTLH